MAITDNDVFTHGATIALIKDGLGSAAVPIDAHTNAETIYDAARDIDAVRVNEIGAGLAACALRLRVGNLSKLAFSIADMTASQTDLDLQIAGDDSGLTAEVMPYPGTVVAIGVLVQNARTAGTLTVNVTINGTKTTLSVVIDGTNAQYFYGVGLPEVSAEAIAAGDRVGCSVTTDASWAAGTTPSVRVGVWVGLAEASS